MVPPVWIGEAEIEQLQGLFELRRRQVEMLQVRLGRTSVTKVQILEGLDEGDRIVLSDTSEWDEFDRIHLN